MNMKLRPLTMCALVACAVVALVILRSGNEQGVLPAKSRAAQAPASAISQTNVLATGVRATAAIQFIPISVSTPLELDGLTKEQVLSVRQQAVALHPELMASPYVPSTAVFGQIEDGRPWWGLDGQFRAEFGPGERSITGPAEESRFLANPFLLVAPNFRGAVPAGSGLEPACLPTYLVWAPKEAIAEVTYDAACIAQWANKPFDLVAYNARDLGLPFIAVDWPKTSGFTQARKTDSAYENPQYIHKGGSCGYPGGCNNMSPSTPPIEGFHVGGLPATMELWLWRDKPAATDAPDFRFRIKFR